MCDALIFSLFFFFTRAAPWRIENLSDTLSFLSRETNTFYVLYTKKRETARQSITCFPNTFYFRGCEIRSKNIYIESVLNVLAIDRH